MPNLSDKFLLSYVREHLHRLGFKGRCQEELQRCLDAICGTHSFTGDFSLFGYAYQVRLDSNLPSLEVVWKSALLSAIETLKWYDRRENPSRTTMDGQPPPSITDLAEYYSESVRFESVLYGTDPWYRDHYAHVLRVWLLGVYVLLEHLNSRVTMPYEDWVDPAYVIQALFDFPEAASAFTVAALAHDIGYPLEKVARLNDELAVILESFGAVEWAPLSVTFSLQQHESAQALLRLLSAKPSFRFYSSPSTPSDPSKLGKTMAIQLAEFRHVQRYQDLEACSRGTNGISVVLRCQSKYLNKYGNSLEKRHHGCLSALLLQRKLIYFMEGEFALEEDYVFNLEEARQFVLRREILRAVASHTCPAIYLLSANSIESLLYFCDEIQDWGRPFFSTLCRGDSTSGDVVVDLHRFSQEEISWRVVFGRELDFGAAANRLVRTGLDLYHRVRPAPESDRRAFGLTCEMEWTCSGATYRARFLASKPPTPAGTNPYVFSVVNQTAHKEKDVFPQIMLAVKGHPFEKVRESVFEELKTLA